MIFGKNKRKQIPAEKSQQNKKSVQTDAESAKPTNKKTSKLQKLKTFLNVVTTLYFIANSLFWVFKKWGDFGGLLWVMLAVTLVYIVVFVATLIKHSKNSQQMSMDNKRFKVQIKFLRALSSLLFIAMSGLTLAQNLISWQTDGNLFMLISIWFSGVVLFFKLISTILRIIKLHKKNKKLKQKQQKINAKQQ